MRVEAGEGGKVGESPAMQSKTEEDLEKIIRE